MRRIPLGVIVAMITSGLLVLGGVIMFIATSAMETASFTWTAYLPTADATLFPGSLIVLTPLMVTGVVLVVVGFVGLGGTTGYLLGRRQHSAA